MPVSLASADSVFVGLGRVLSVQTPVKRGEPYRCVKYAVMVKPAHRGMWINTQFLYSISVVTSVFFVDQDFTCPFYRPIVQEYRHWMGYL